MSLPNLTPEQQLEAKHLEAKINAAIANEVADIARLLVGTGDKNLFGATEFQVARSRFAYRCQSLQRTFAQKKTATMAAPSIAQGAGKRQGSRTFVR